MVAFILLALWSPPKYSVAVMRVISSRSKLLALFVCLFALWAGALPALAASWQEHRDAGFLSFSNADYRDAVEHLKRAIDAAEEEGASAEELGLILEKLTTSYFATGWFGPAEDTISKWDKVLQASAGEPWVPQQQVDRDRLALLVSEVLAQREPATETGKDPPKQVEKALPTEEDHSNIPFYPELPFQPDDKLSINSDQAAEKQPATAASSKNYAIHLVSLKSEAAVNDSWAILQESYPDLLGDKNLEVKEIDLGEQGRFYRIHAGFFASSAEAEATCEKLQLLQQYCKVIEPD